jgi:hypothetical protein
MGETTMLRAVLISASLIVLLFAPAQAGEVLTTGMEDQTGVELTVYNSDLGLVKDRRTIMLFRGERELRFMDVASRVIPQSVHIKPVDAKGFEVLEQNYEYDLLSPQKLMEKYVGKKVKLHYRNPYTDKKEIKTAEILSTNNGTVLRVGDEISFGYEGRIVFPSVPENLISRPTLVWLLRSKREGHVKLETSYLTTGINWRADYVLTLAGDDKMADLTGWVTIDNKSGTAYRDAKLKLVAGDVHRARPEYMRQKMVMAEAAMAPRDQFREEAFFEYHIYTLERRSTIKDNQIKQISLLTAEKIPVKKEFVLKGASHYYQGRYGDIPKQKVGVFIELTNSKRNNLGMPLPKGIVRMYKMDSEGSLQFIGEDSVDHTPKDEDVRLKVGEAFDVVGTRKQTDWKRSGKNTHESAFEITIANHKEEDVTVKVVEPIPGDWRMLSSSHKYKKTDAYTVEFNVPVRKDQKSTLTYRVRVKY